MHTILARFLVPMDSLIDGALVVNDIDIGGQKVLLTGPVLLRYGHRFVIEHDEPDSFTILLEHS